MKKSNIRDYAVSAFEMYAREGKPTSAELLEKLKKSRKEYLSYTANDKCLKIKARRLSADTQKIRSIYLDVYAIEQAILNPIDERDELILKCVEKTYFEIGKFGNKKGRTDALVTSCSMELNISISCVYTYLNEAVKRFCLKRGLRIDE